MSDLSPREYELLAKIGISKEEVDKMLSPKTRVKKAPEEVDISGRSGIMIANCQCCGNTSEKYMDFIKRVDAPGHVIKFVEKPSHAIKVRYSSCTTSCDACEDLSEFKRKDLIQMILNLRQFEQKRLR